MENISIPQSAVYRMHTTFMGIAVVIAVVCDLYVAYCCCLVKKEAL